MNELSHFETVLEMIDELPLEEQGMLLEIAYHRFTERWRMGLAEEIAAAREAYRRGNVRRGTAEDLIRVRGRRDSVTGYWFAR